MKKLTKAEAKFILKHRDRFTREEVGRAVVANRVKRRSQYAKQLDRAIAARRRAERRPNVSALKARNRRRRKSKELSFFGITAKDLNMNPNRRR